MRNVTEKISSPIETLADRDTKERKEFITRLAADLRKVLTDGSEVIEEFEVRRLYSRDLADIPAFLEKTLFRTTPLIVVTLASEKDASALLVFASKKKIPVFPRGIASWGFGGAIPTTSGIVADTSRMQKIIDTDETSGRVAVQPGVKWGELDKHLKEYGLTLAVYPSNRFSTVGGWISTGGFGINSYKYKHLHYWTEEIHLAVPNGKILHLDKNSDKFGTIFGSEGQLGIITKVVLKVIRDPGFSMPYVIQGESKQKLFNLVLKINKAGCLPSHIMFMDEIHAKLVNSVWRQKNGKPGEKIITEKPSLLIHFDDSDAKDKFNELFSDEKGLTRAPVHEGYLLWEERFSPMKVQVYGTSLLACELIIPPETAVTFMEEAKKLASRMKAELFIESHIIRKSTGLAVLVMPMFNCDRRKTFQYYIYLSLVSMLTMLGIKSGGSPYGIGIWNAPLADSEARRVINRVLEYKKEIDPEGLINPGKFWHLRSRFYGLPARLFKPLLFRITLRALISAAPFIGMFLRKPVPPDRNTDPLMLTALKCTNCGNCVTVCHAVAATGDEAVSPRSKLRLARRLSSGKLITKIESDRAFICTRCGSCEQICQSDLPLLEAWDQLEAKLEKIHGRPEEKIKDFIKNLGDNTDYLDKIDSEPF